MIFKFLDLLSSPTGCERNLKAIWQYKPLTFSLPSVKHHGRSIIMLGSSAVGLVVPLTCSQPKHRSR
ncbi:hypothetical protein RchiOBHm_Chr7g0233881 [Rosa chinensis]|uniref:Uncharacterized protein n=1 Tax=Rosa chinensis TaxID=74649 RepID=A0A2P6PGA3_ROSCH|nr:hypothetical protein RchiOBHm_Chr7g0233881 [Rosa chinensis]